MSQHLNPISLILCSLLFFVLCVGCQPTTDLKQCAHDDVCSKGEICKDSKCITGCREHRDCPRSTPHCIQGLCQSKVCTPGTQRKCYGGRPGTQDLGECKAGQQICNQDGTQWSPCFRQILPHNEICDRADNDCDGQVDEGISCDCKTGEKRSCYTGPSNTLNVGVCRAGVQFCDPKDNMWTACLQQVRPTPELCDDKDNDCNGKVDEVKDCECNPGTTRVCYQGITEEQAKQPLCKAGTQECLPSKRWGDCVGVIPPKKEDTPCSGKDENCDGKIQQCGCTPNTIQKCFSGTAEQRKHAPCRAGERVCLKNGTWNPTCEGEIRPKKEIPCNGKDEDCDGKDLCEKKTWTAFIDRQVTQKLTFSFAEGIGIVTDKQNNMYAYGTLITPSKFHHPKTQTTMTLPKTTPSTSSIADQAYLLKVDAQGSLIWMHIFGTSDTDPTHMAISPNGRYIALVGHFRGIHFTVNSTTPQPQLILGQPLQSSSYVALVDVQGNTNGDVKYIRFIQPVKKQTKSSLGIQLHTVDVDDSGRIAFAGHTTVSMLFRSPSSQFQVDGSNQRNIQDTFIGHLNSNGDWIQNLTRLFTQSRRDPNKSQSSIWNIRMYKKSLYAVGFFTDSLTVSNLNNTKNAVSLIKQGQAPFSLFFARWDANGTLTHRLVGGEQTSYPVNSHNFNLPEHIVQGLAFHPKDNSIWIAGRGRGRLRFGSKYAGHGAQEDHLFLAQIKLGSTRANWTDLYSWEVRGGGVIPTDLKFSHGSLFLAGGYKGQLNASSILKQSTLSHTQDDRSAGYIIQFNLHKKAVSWSARLNTIVGRKLERTVIRSISVTPKGISVTGRHQAQKLNIQTGLHPSTVEHFTSTIRSAQNQNPQSFISYILFK